MSIRKIQKEDLARCSEILEKAYSTEPYNEEFNEGMASLYVQQKYKCCFDNSFVVCDESDQVIGFAFVSISAWTDGLQAVIEEVCVDPLFQGKGLGKALILYIHDYLSSKKIKSIMLWAKNDKKLIDFYVSSGYQVADDFCVMFKEVK